MATSSISEADWKSFTHRGTPQPIEVAAVGLVIAGVLTHQEPAQNDQPTVKTQGTPDNQ